MSTLILIALGKPAALLVIAGSLNGLILPLTLAAILLAAKNKKIIGEYKHPAVLYYLGWLVVIGTAYMGVGSLQKLGALFN